MKKSWLVLSVAVATLSAVNVAKADEYSDCMAKATIDQEIVMCNNAEAARLMRNLQKRYNAISSNKYFSSWDDKTLSAAQNFQLLFRQWVDYRDKYCSLYGFTFTQGQGTLGSVQESQCLIDLTKHFAKDVESVIDVYNKMAVN